MLRHYNSQLHGLIGPDAHHQQSRLPQHHNRQFPSAPDLINLPIKAIKVVNHSGILIGSLIAGGLTLQFEHLSKSPQPVGQQAQQEPHQANRRQQVPKQFRNV